MCIVQNSFYPFPFVTDKFAIEYDFLTLSVSFGTFVQTAFLNQKYHLTYFFLCIMKCLEVLPNSRSERIFQHFVLYFCCWCSFQASFTWIVLVRLLWNKPAHPQTFGFEGVDSLDTFTNLALIFFSRNQYMVGTEDLLDRVEFMKFTCEPGGTKLSGTPLSRYVSNFI